MKKIAIFLLFFMVLTVSINAEQYKIGPNDLLEISFWQDVQLNAEVYVTQDGMITLDVIGSIEAAGKTTKELQELIVQRMSRLNTRISQAVVRVKQYNYQHLFIKGEVGKSGKLSFENIPDLWTVINEAGGVTPYGDLSRVTIIRGGENAGKIEVVDVLSALNSGQLDKLPKLKRLDTIEIPKNPVGLPSSDLSNQIKKDKNLIYVIGAVKAPGPIKFEENVDILEALALAGGPSNDADMKRARIITKDGQYGQSIEVNLEKYTESGYPARYIMRSEDTFVLPAKKGGLFGLSLGGVVQVLGVVSSAVLIYDRLNSNN